MLKVAGAALQRDDAYAGIADIVNRQSDCRAVRRDAPVRRHMRKPGSTCLQGPFAPHGVECVIGKGLLPLGFAQDAVGSVKWAPVFVHRAADRNKLRNASSRCNSEELVGSAIGCRNIENPFSIGTRLRQNGRTLTRIEFSSGTILQALRVEAESTGAIGFEQNGLTVGQPCSGKIGAGVVG